MDEGSQDNQDIVVLPDHLFRHTLELDDLKCRVQQAQSEKAFQMEEWKEKYELIMDNGTWTLNGRTIIPEDDDLQCEIMAASYDHVTAGHLLQLQGAVWLMSLQVRFQ